MPLKTRSNTPPVTWNKRREKWQVKLTKNKKPFYLGYFNTLPYAIEVYEMMLKKRRGSKQGV